MSLSVILLVPTLTYILLTPVVFVLGSPCPIVVVRYFTNVSVTAREMSAAPSDTPPAS